MKHETTQGRFHFRKFNIKTELDQKYLETLSEWRACTSTLRYNKTSYLIYFSIILQVYYQLIYQYYQLLIHHLMFHLKLMFLKTKPKQSISAKTKKLNFKIFLPMVHWYTYNIIKILLISIFLVNL